MFNRYLRNKKKQRFPKYNTWVRLGMQKSFYEKYKISESLLFDKINNAFK